MTDLQRLRAKLCRELAQSEQSARVHPRREARRLGDVPPAVALLAIAEHADSLAPRFESLMEHEQRVGPRLASLGRLWSAFRHAVLDRLVDAERSYRGALLGLDRGLDLTRLLLAVAGRLGDDHLVLFCDELLAARVPLVAIAERRLAWFAEQPGAALRSNLLVAGARTGGPAR